MGTRAEELRRRDRRVFGVALLVAALLHVVVFVAFPGFRVEVLGTPDIELDTAGIAGGANASVELHFGPTVVRLADGGAWTAPPDRFLEADRPIRLARRCRRLAGLEHPLAGGSVGLRIKVSGRVDVLGLVSSTGDPCVDGIISEAAGALWYHWLPNDRFPAPLDVEQPVTLVATRLAGL